MADFTLISLATGSVADTDVFLKSDANGVLTKVTAKELLDHALFKSADFQNSGFHNSIFRGKQIGTSVSAEQYSLISSGQFTDMFIGDYWRINNINWRIAAFDYWFNHGDTACNTHHVVIVPDSNLASGPMNSSNITTGAYVGSGYYTGVNADETENTLKATAQTAINNAFGSSHILTHREYFSNAVDNGHESAAAWYDSTFELMTEQMVYGCKVFGNILHNDTTFPQNRTIGTSQLPLFALDHRQICNRGNWWLRDVVSATNFADVLTGGFANYDGASAARGIRPAFGIRA